MPHSSPVNPNRSLPASNDLSCSLGQVLALSGNTVRVSHGLTIHKVYSLPSPSLNLQHLDELSVIRNLCLVFLALPWGNQPFYKLLRGTTSC